MNRLCKILLMTSALSDLGASAEKAKGITVGWESAPRSIDPRYNADANSQYLEGLLHCSLVTFDSNGATTGDLAKSRTWATPTKLTIKLQPAHFSNGDRVTAADVKATYDFFMGTPKEPSPRAGSFRNINKLSVVDNQTIVFELKEADATFETNLVVGILPAAWASKPRLTVKDPIPGCGPFVIGQQKLGQFQLITNRHYSLGPKPKTHNVTIKVVADESTRTAKLIKGELDIVQNEISRDKLAKLEKHPRLKVIRRPGLRTSYLGFNMKDPILSKAKVRQAIAHSIQRQVIIDYILKGYAIPARTLLPPTDQFFNDKIGDVTYDPKKAAKLLDEAGYPDPDGEKKGKWRFEVVFKTTTQATRVQIARAIASQMRKVGIKVEVQSLEWGRFKADVEKGAVQMWMLKWIGFKDPDIFRYAFATESFPPNGANRGWYSNAKLDQLLTSGRLTTDAKSRQEYYHQAQTIVADELPYVFLWHEEVFAAVNRSLKDFDLYADGRFSSLVSAYVQ